MLFIICERNFYTIGESRAISFNATDPEKQTQQLCINKVDANSRREELSRATTEHRIEIQEEQQRRKRQQETLQRREQRFAQ